MAAVSMTEQFVRKKRSAADTPCFSVKSGADELRDKMAPLQSSSLLYSDASIGFFFLC